MISSSELIFRGYSVQTAFFFLLFFLPLFYLSFFFFVSSVFLFFFSLYFPYTSLFFFRFLLHLIHFLPIISASSFSLSPLFSFSSTSPFFFSLDCFIFSVFRQNDRTTRLHFLEEAISFRQNSNYARLLFIDLFFLDSYRK